MQRLAGSWVGTYTYLEADVPGPHTIGFRLRFLDARWWRLTGEVFDAPDAGVEGQGIISGWSCGRHLWFRKMCALGVAQNPKPIPVADYMLLAGRRDAVMPAALYAPSTRPHQEDPRETFCKSISTSVSNQTMGGDFGWPDRQTPRSILAPVRPQFEGGSLTRRKFLAGIAVGGPAVLNAFRGVAQSRTPTYGVDVGEPAKLLVIRNVAVVDARTGNVRPHMTVTLAADRIRAVQPAATRVPPEAQIIEGSGKFLIPGLWDMHSHGGSPSASSTYPLMIATGVTGTRVMRGNPEYVSRRSAISSGKQLGPRLIIASPILDGPGGESTSQSKRIVSNAEQGRLAVRQAVQEGADFIKVYELISRDSYFAIADEAHKAGVPFVGHIPRQLTPVECAMAGQKSIEHLFGIGRACCDGYEDWRHSIIDSPNPGAVPNLEGRLYVETFRASRVSAIAEVFKKQGTWVCPTRVAGRAIEGDPVLTDNPDLAYVAKGQRDLWNKNLESEDLPINRRNQQNVAPSVLRELYAGGVRLLPGTDITSEPFLVPGFSLHLELQFLVQEGVKAQDALRAATYAPAEFLGKLDTLGTVDPGKVADLVLLDANPSDDIANTQKIDAVIAAGRLFRKSAREQILQEVRSAVAG